MIAGSNALYVVLPPGMGMHAATAAFGRFGDVAKVEVLPSDVSTATVVFFDVRAATRAINVLGADWCWPREQCGERTIRIPGAMQLSADDFARVSGVRQDPAGGDGYEVEFFDVRDAARMNATCSRTAQAAKVAKAPGQLDKLEPVFVTPSAAFTPAAASTETAETSVLLQGLPNGLCSRPCFEAVLEQAGLQGDVVSLSIRPGSPCGEAVVKVAGLGAVERCIKHFHGRGWHSAGTPVSATKLAPPPGLVSTTQVAPPPGLSPAAKSVPLPSLLSATKLAPPPCFPKGMDEAALAPPPGLTRLCVIKDEDTEESTDAGASEAEEYQDECLGEVCSAML